MQAEAVCSICSLDQQLDVVPYVSAQDQVKIIILDVSAQDQIVAQIKSNHARITQFQTYLFSFSKKILVSSSVSGLIFSATVICKPRLLSLISVITFQNLLGQISQLSLYH